MSYKKNINIPVTSKYIDEHMVEYVSEKEKFLSLIKLYPSVNQKLCYADISELEYNASGDNEHDRSPYVTTGFKNRYLTLMKGDERLLDRYVINLDVFEEEEIKAIVYYLEFPNSNNIDNQRDILKLFNPSLETKRLVKSEIKTNFDKMIESSKEKYLDEINKTNKYEDFKSKLEYVRFDANYLSTKEDVYCDFKIMLPPTEDMSLTQKIFYEKIFKDMKIIIFRISYKDYENLENEITLFINKIKNFEPSFKAIKDLKKEILEIKSKISKGHKNNRISLKDYELNQSQKYSIDFYSTYDRNLIKEFNQNEIFLDKEIKRGERYKIDLEKVSKEDLEKNNYNLDKFFIKIENKENYFDIKSLEKNAIKQIEGKKQISSIKIRSTISMENIKTFYECFIKNKNISIASEFNDTSLTY